MNIYDMTVKNNCITVQWYILYLPTSVLTGQLFEPCHETSSVYQLPMWLKFVAGVLLISTVGLYYPAVCEMATAIDNTVDTKGYSTYLYVTSNQLHSEHRHMCSLRELLIVRL